MSDHRSIEWAVDIIGMCQPIRCHQGGMWFGSNHNFADATFVDYGAADAFAVAAQALPGMVKALEDARAALARVVDSSPAIQINRDQAIARIDRVLARVGGSRE